MTPDNALKLLIEGNQRFINGTSSLQPRNEREDLTSHVANQTPFAAILGCADSRVIPEVLFDQGLGAIFTVRVAGNIAGASQIGSIEVSIAFGISLIVVLGHSGCGAINATLNYENLPDAIKSDSIKNLVDRIEPVIENAIMNEELTEEQKFDTAVKHNALYWAQELKRKSPMIKKAIDDGALKVVAAQYHLDTGKVEILSQ